MVLYKRKNVRRNLYKRASNMYGRTRRNRLYRKRKISNQTHSFKRMVTLTSLRSDTASDYSTNYVFKLSDLPNYTEFTNLFDEYKITTIVLKFTPLYQQNLSALDYGEIYSVLDRDDNAILNLSQIQQYQNVKIRHGLKGTKVVIKPRMKGAVFNTSATPTGYVMSPSTSFIDCAYPDVTHYCLKNVWTVAGVATYQRVDATYYLKFRNVR